MVPDHIKNHIIIVSTSRLHDGREGSLYIDILCTSTISTCPQSRIGKKRLNENIKISAKLGFFLNKCTSLFIFLNLEVS